MPYEDLDGVVEEFHAPPDNALVFVMSSDEEEATAAWKYLIAEGVVNLYILEGGVNHWIDPLAGAVGGTEVGIARCPAVAPGDGSGAGRPCGGSIGRRRRAISAPCPVDWISASTRLPG
ncbi:MAG: hypothetical protein IPK19_18725 [Chloroflexi bacterium]|nr:hypothetical protein [Chloroflexota bacterium]